MNKFKCNSSDYNDLKNYALAQQPLRISGFLSDLKFSTYNEVFLLGKSLLLTETARKSLLNILKIHSSVDGLLKKTLGEKNRDSFILTIQQSIAAQKDRKLTFLIDKQNKKLEDVISSNIHVFGNELFFNLAEVYLEVYDLTIVNFAVGPLGEIGINTLSDQNKWKIANFKDEEFTSGVSLTNDYKGGISFSAYLNRLVCENGLIAKHFEDTFTIKKISPKSIDSFNTKVKTLADREFKPIGFEQKVIHSKKINASFYELESAHNIISQIGIKNDAEVEKRVPLEHTINQFRNIKVDVQNLTFIKKKNAKTGTKIWDLVNGLTHVASHHPSLIDYPNLRSKIMVSASELLCKNYDMDNVVKSPF